MNKPKIRALSVFVAIVGVILTYGAIASFAYGFAGNGGQIAIASHTVELDVETDGDIITVVGNDNYVQKSAVPEAQRPQGSKVLYLPLLVGLALAIVGVYYLLISGWVYRAVDAVQIWRKQ